MFQVNPQGHFAQIGRAAHHRTPVVSSTRKRARRRVDLSGCKVAFGVSVVDERVVGLWTCARHRIDRGLLGARPQEPPATLVVKTALRLFEIARAAHLLVALVRAIVLEIAHLGRVHALRLVLALKISAACRRLGGGGRKAGERAQRGRVVDDAIGRE